MEKDLLAYETPQVEVIEVEIEKGFAASPDSGDGEGNMPDGDGWN